MFNQGCPQDLVHATIQLIAIQQTFQLQSFYQKFSPGICGSPGSRPPSYDPLWSRNNKTIKVAGSNWSKSRCLHLLKE